MVETGIVFMCFPCCLGDPGGSGVPCGPIGFANTLSGKDVPKERLFNRSAHPPARIAHLGFHLPAVRNPSPEGTAIDMPSRPLAATAVVGHPVLMVFFNSAQTGKDSPGVLPLPPRRPVNIVVHACARYASYTAGSQA